MIAATATVSIEIDAEKIRRRNAGYHRRWKAKLTAAELAEQRRKKADWRRRQYACMTVAERIEFLRKREERKQRRLNPLLVAIAETKRKEAVPPPVVKPAVVPLTASPTLDETASRCEAAYLAWLDTKAAHDALAKRLAPIAETPADFAAKATLAPLLDAARAKRDAARLAVIESVRAAGKGWVALRTGRLHLVLTRDGFEAIPRGNRLDDRVNGVKPPPKAVVYVALWRKHAETIRAIHADLPPARRTGLAIRLELESRTGRSFDQSTVSKACDRLNLPLAAPRQPTPAPRVKPFFCRSRP
jgi:hypothetical protein